MHACACVRVVVVLVCLVRVGRLLAALRPPSARGMQCWSHAPVSRLPSHHCRPSKTRRAHRRPDGDDDGRMAVRRGMFAFSFGKQQQRRVLSDEAAAGLADRRKYISERTRDPKDIARQQQQRAAGR